MPNSLVIWKKALTLPRINNLNIRIMKTQIENLAKEVKEAKTYTADGRQAVANNCAELYSLIEKGLHAKFGNGAIKDAHSDLCEGDFSEPFMCEQKKGQFTTYSTIYINHVA